METIKGSVIWHPDRGILPAYETDHFVVSKDNVVTVLGRQMIKEGWQIRSVEVRFTDEEPSHE